jgi:hypothetical protein
MLLRHILEPAEQHRYLHYRRTASWLISHTGTFRWISNCVTIRTKPSRCDMKSKLWCGRFGRLTIPCQAVDSQQNPASCYWLDEFHAENKHPHTEIHYSFQPLYQREEHEHCFHSNIVVTVTAQPVNRVLKTPTPSLFLFSILGMCMVEYLNNHIWEADKVYTGIPNTIVLSCKEQKVIWKRGKVQELRNNHKTKNQVSRLNKGRKAPAELRSFEKYWRLK